jgi:hypothetical protein
MLAPELDAKRLELLHQAVPAARRIAVLGTSTTEAKENLAAVRSVAEALGLDLLVASTRKFLQSIQRLSPRCARQAQRGWRSFRPRISLPRRRLSPR